ncbi:MAG: GDSL-type esterase/lipase family protein, partial [Planctomycetota bacterium]
MRKMNYLQSGRKRASLLCLAIGLQALLSSGSAEAKPFEFQKDDVVALIGNGLADRMQHTPWVETVLQNELKDLKLRFRNMSFAGDMVNKRPRNKGFTSDEAYLKHVKPSVLLVFYGYNESFAGAGGADGYRSELVKLVKRYQGVVPGVRVALFSPIAFENTGDPNLPNGIEHNARLAAYTDATRRAAEDLGSAYVNLYLPTFQLFESSSERYTYNGVHLNGEGYRKLSEIMADALLEKDVKAGDHLAKLYAAIEDKNWHWHNRYRATDGNDVWGGRSGLRFVDGQTNATVLKHELTMLDVMTANRDPAIWAAAEGRSYKIDDSNVPAPIKVISNVGGKSRSSNKNKEGNLNYLSPEASAAKIKTPEGFEINVFASEVQFPDLANPVQLQVDSKGRLWAASWNTYPKWEPGKAMNDSLMIFEDDDRDGKADKRKIFSNV